jgi:hypothetical protein
MERNLASFRRATDGGCAEGMVSCGPFHYPLLFRKFAASPGTAGYA